MRPIGCGVSLKLDHNCIPFGVKFEKSKNFYFILFYFFIVTSALHLFSMDIVTIVARDNLNYSNFYLNISIEYNLARNYFIYKTQTGASEPVFFLLAVIFKNFDFSYSYFIFSLNCFFLYSLSFFIAKLRVNLVFVLVLGVYYSCDYYFFSLLSEIHRLKLAASFFFLAFGARKGSIHLFTILMVLSHFQTMILIYLLFDFSNNKKIIFLFIFSLCFAIGGAIYNKIMYYLSFDVNSMINSFFMYAVLFVFFLFLTFYVLGFLKKKYLISMLLIFFPIILVGHERLNIFVIEGSVMYFFHYLSKGKRVNDLKFLTLLIFVFFIGFYNLIKINSQYQYLMDSYSYEHHGNGMSLNFTRLKRFNISENHFKRLA